MIVGVLLLILPLDTNWRSAVLVGVSVVADAIDAELSNCRSVLVVTPSGVALVIVPVLLSTLVSCVATVLLLLEAILPVETSWRSTVLLMLGVVDAMTTLLTNWRSTVAALLVGVTLAIVTDEVRWRVVPDGTRILTHRCER